MRASSYMSGKGLFIMGLFKKHGTDKNGLIDDNDAVYKKLDKMYCEKKHEQIAETILNIPPEKRSNKLLFRLIGTYSDLKRFDKAELELEKLQARCKSPSDRAQWFYMNGRVKYMNGRTFTAMHCYEDGLQADPSDAAGLNLKQEIDNCRAQTEKDLELLHDMSEKIVQDIKKRCSEKSDSEKLNPSDEQFTLELGFLPGIRKIPGQERGLGFDEYFKKLEGEKKELAKGWLEKLFGITDNESFKDFIKKDINCNMAHFGDDAIALINKKPSFNLSELNSEGKRLFQDTTLFVNAFAEYLPEAGTHAWDICEKIGFLRHAYSVDYLSQEEYISCMMSLSEDAKKKFSSAEEYVTSLIFGCGLYMFMLDECSTESGAKFLSQMAVFVINGDLPHILWKK